MGRYCGGCIVEPTPPEVDNVEFPSVSDPLTSFNLPNIFLSSFDFDLGLSYSFLLATGFVVWDRHRIGTPVALDECENSLKHALVVSIF